MNLPLSGALWRSLPAQPTTASATAAVDAQGSDVIADSYQPSATLRNGENIGLEPVWPYGVITDSTTVNGDNLTALADRTYNSRPNANNPDWSSTRWTPPGSTCPARSLLTSPPRRCGSELSHRNIRSSGMSYLVAIIEYMISSSASVFEKPVTPVAGVPCETDDPMAMPVEHLEAR
ncbi:MAG: hypothetical protein JWM19_1484, partial [Actinomycetia bacterium]|nr:hypothetical protein [Actinomycetes bacterium]